MRIKNFLLFFFSFIILSSFVFTKSALADTFSLSGSVKDNTGAAVVGATVDVYNSGTTTDVVSPTTTDSNGNYSFASVPQGTYDIKITPPSGSNFSSAIALSQNISANTILNFVLSPSGTVTFSGHLYDENGTAVPNQSVTLRLGSNSPQTVQTDSTGAYSLTVIAGTYSLSIGGANPNTSSFTAGIPQNYSLFNSSFSLTRSTIVNINLPIKRVVVHTQDSSGNSISNVALRALPTAGQNNTINANLSLGGGITAAGVSQYLNQGTPFTTDTNGNVTLWLFPNDSNSSYAFTAIPSSSSTFSNTVAQNIIISGDTTQTITMQPAIFLSGHIYDENGIAASNQSVTIRLGSNSPQTAQTDSTGFYSLKTVAGTYSLSVGGANPNTSSFTAGVPQNYSLFNSSYSLTQNTTLDITLPAKRVAVHVQAANGNPVSNVALKVLPTAGQNNTINANLPISTGLTAAGVSQYLNQGTSFTTDTNGNVILWLFPNDSNSSYKFTAIPPSGNTFITTIISNIIITGDTSETITLPQPVTLSGHVYDESGNPASNQSVILGLGTGSPQTAQTDSTGFYSLSVTTGTYPLNVTGGNPNTSNFTAGIPQDYTLAVPSYSITQNTTLDFTVPAKKVSVHVQDPNGNPINNTALQVLPTAGQNHTINGNLTISSGITASANSQYLNQSTQFKTDASGNVTLWLFTNDSNSSYTFTAIPPTGGIYTQINLQNILVTGTQTEVISLQYNHATPVTTASLSPTPFSDGTYADPTTVTLSASAAAGYTVANTYYTVDGGTQQIYSAPFTVTGAGSHTITYWSVDNSGVQETHSSKTFTITEAYSLTGTVYVDANQNGLQDTGENGYAGATVTLNETGQTATTDSNGNYTFPNLEAGTYTVQLTDPSGYADTTSNPATVALAANTTRNFGIAQGCFGANGCFTVDSLTYDHSTHNITMHITSLNPNIDVTKMTHASINQTNSPHGYWGKSGSCDNSGNCTFTADLNNGGTYNGIPGDSVWFFVDDAGNTPYYSYGTSQAFTLDANGNLNYPGNVLVTAINAGGDTAGNYVADTDSSGGSTYTSSASVDTSGVSNPAPQAVYQTVRYGNFTYTIPNLTANGTYTLRLHFNELYWGTSLAGGNGGVGSRVFNVSVNGTNALANFDIYQAAGGANKAVVEQIPATADSNGNITVQFSTVTDNAMVNGIELYNGTLPSPTPTPTPTPVQSVAINTGGSVSGSFVADADFNGGTPYSSNASVDTSSVTNPAPQSVYQSVRYGNFTYTIPTYSPSTSYHVRLHFNELYWGTPLSGNQGGTGSRVFNVTINGTQVLNNFDIYQTAGGANKALTEDFDTTTDSLGRINIQFSTVADNPVVNGIEISKN